MSEGANGKGANGSGATTLELPLVDLPGGHPCHDCGKCCHYIATEIDEPSGFNDYENLHWYLLHDDVSVYIDWEGDWFIEFETRCKHLTPTNTCGIYETRPKICSEFSWDECEITAKERAWKYRFTQMEEFVDWLAERRPKAHAKYMKSREKLIRKRRAASEPQADPEPAPAEPRAEA